MLERAAELVRRRTGLVFGEARSGALATGISHAYGRAGVPTPEAWLDRLQHEPALLDDLVAEITVGETYFFREPAQCAVIRTQILPALLARPDREAPLRMWSAGCASGEEPYTLAMILREVGCPAAHVVGSDISRTALARARRGRYTRWSLRALPEEHLGSSFLRVGDQFTLVPALQEAVEFRYLNLAEDIYPSLASGVWGMDLILCRNVLIYFDSETIARVARRLLDCLNNEGWLLLGSSDPLLANIVPCDVTVTPAGLAYRRAGAAAPVPPIHPTEPAELASARVETVDEPEPASDALPEVVAAPASAEDHGEGDEALRSYRAGDYERAAELAAHAVARDRGDLPRWILLVRALANHGRLEAAGRASAAALDQHQTSAELTYLHAVLLGEAGHHDAAARAARRALYLDRGLIVAHLALAGALARLGDRAGARRALGNAEHLLAALAPGASVPAGDGELARRLLEMARVQLALLTGEAA